MLQSFSWTHVGSREVSAFGADKFHADDVDLSRIQASLLIVYSTPLSGGGGGGGGGKGA